MIGFLGVFVGMVALDFCYGEYTKAGADRRAFAASNWAAVLYACNAFVMLNVIANPWVIIAAVCGAWVGTFLSINR